MLYDAVVLIRPTGFARQDEVSEAAGYGLVSPGVIAVGDFDDAGGGRAGVLAAAGSGPLPQAWAGVSS